MKKRIMITTIYSARAIKVAITKLSPDKVICVVEDEYDKATDEDSKIKRQAIKELKIAFGDILEIEVLKTKSLYDVPEIMKDIIKKIDEIPEEYKIVIHISEGRKSLAFGLSFAGYMRKGRIEGVYYVIADNNKLIKLPTFNFPINEVEKEILKSVYEKKLADIETLIKKVGKSRSVIYQYVKQLQNDGYLSSENKHLELTDLGRVMIL